MSINPNSLYERLGGRHTINEAVDNLYNRIFNDEKLVPFFENVNPDKQAQKQIAFMTVAFGGPGNYSGEYMRSKHAPLISKGLNDEHVDIFISHFKDTLRELGIENDLIEEAAEVANSYRHDVLNR
jgi:hemoglobin